MTESLECRFRLGINYWPSATAMEFWNEFDASVVTADFERIARCGFDSVRIFLRWEDFQPSPSRTERLRIDDLIRTLALAQGLGLSVMPTLFTGHMSGVNWIPRWALAETGGDDRFRVVAGGRVVSSGIANWYSDGQVARAQANLAGELAGALAGHPALWAWDLGNENSNCCVPPSSVSARDWLLKMSDALRSADPETPVTLGLHMEDLEQDRQLGPREAAQACDFLQMHGYPGYASWSKGPTDEHVLPFLARLTRWLGGGTEVLFAEFGVPTRLPADTPQGAKSEKPALVDEYAAARYVERALDALLASDCMGAMLWCYSDYAPAIWQRPPLDVAHHERSFGLWRSDGHPKPSALGVEALARRGFTRTGSPQLPDESWLDLDADQFYRAPALELPRLYRRYREAAQAQ